jgi:ubiquinone/menaquinone biosynthesis C-methylase UbiE
MEPKLHRRVQRYGWDRAVEDYDRYFVPVLRHCSERCVGMLELQPGERVLDVATGPGVAAFLAEEKVGREGVVVATDISEKMVEAAREEAERRGVSNIEFERVDAEDLSYPRESFDAVLCVLGLMFPADPQRAIEEMYSVLKRGGRAAVCVWGRRERCGWASIFPIVESRIQSDVCPLFFQLGFEGALTRAFSQAGFQVDSEERMSRTLEFPGAPEMLAAVFRGGAVALAYSRFSDQVREEADREFLESVEQYRHSGPGEHTGYSLPGEFVFALAHKA